MEYAATRSDDAAEVVATGKGVIVLVNYQTGDKVPIPDELRAAIDELQARQ